MSHRRTALRGANLTIHDVRVRDAEYTYMGELQGQHSYAFSATFDFELEVRDAEGEVTVYPATGFEESYDGPMSPARADRYRFRGLPSGVEKHLKAKLARRGPNAIQQAISKYVKSRGIRRARVEASGDDELRDRVIRLAYARPELRADLLPLITASEPVRSLESVGQLSQVAEEHANGRQSSLMVELVDKRGLSKAIRKARREDPELATLLRQLLDEVAGLLNSKQEQAITRLNNLAGTADGLDVAAMRNQAAKIAELLGLPMPKIY